MFPFLRKVPSVPGNAVPSEVINLTWRVKLQSEPTAVGDLEFVLLWAAVLYSSAIYFCMVGFVAIIVFEYMQYFLPQLHFQKKKNEDMLHL